MSNSSSDLTEDTRERLLRAAAELFAEGGYEGTSVKELAQRAEVNVSLVSYHFGGKEGLFKACLEQVGDEGLRIAERTLKPPVGGEELRLRLRMFVEEMIQLHLTKPMQMRILHRECDLQSSVAQEIFRNKFHPIFETLTRFIESARQNGFLKKDLNPAIAAMLLFGSILHPIKMQNQTRNFLGVSIQDVDFREQVIDHVVTLFLRGFSA
jgi:AcrR family transcriptional regulator